MAIIHFSKRDIEQFFEGQRARKARAKQLGASGGFVLMDLLRAQANQLSKKKLLNSHWQDFDRDVLDKVITVLESAGLVEQRVINGVTMVALTQTALEKLRD